jgi:hypothetical protein
MDKHNPETINYKKKYPKCLHHYMAMMLMVDTFKLDKSSSKLLFGILDEKPLEDWEWEKMVDKSRRIRAIFSEHPFYWFGNEYPIAVKAAFGKIRIMSN